jgi:hypothetical protein
MKLKWTVFGRLFPTTRSIHETDINALIRMRLLKEDERQDAQA